MVKVALQGCCHGDLDKIYHAVDLAGGADIVLIGGDFQAVRNTADLSCLNVPKKYLRLGDFHEYYSQKKKAKYLTVFIGGNHEASNYLSELFYGGWVAPNIYYLGKAGSLIFKGLRISGISGIYNFNNFRKGHFEKPPYSDQTIRSVYHVRDFEINKLASLTVRPDLMLSHDWPNNIEKYGDVNRLLKVKPGFRNEVRNNSLGSPPLEFLLNQLKPHHWLSAHLHIHFKAVFVHKSIETSAPDLPSNIQPEVQPEENSDEIALDFDSPNLENKSAPVGSEQPENASPLVPSKKPKLDIANEDELDLGTITEPEVLSQAKLLHIENRTNDSKEKPREPSISNTTQFTALDKCIAKHRTFIEFQEIFPTDVKLGPLYDSNDLFYDLEWLAITRAFQPFLSLEFRTKKYPDYETMQSSISDSQTALRIKLGLKAGETWYPIPCNFKAEALDSLQPYPPIPTKLHNNSQTQAFCDLIEIPNHL